MHQNFSYENTNKNQYYQNIQRNMIPLLMSNYKNAIPTWKQH